MYQPILFVHWKQVRLALLPFILCSFGLPLLSVQGLGGGLAEPWDAYRALNAAELWLPLYPVLAAAIGTTLALSAWNWDHQLKHVYALSLPLHRWQYVLLKMGGGMALALAPAFAFWAGAHLAVAFVSLPPGLNTYPNELALRFFLAIVVSYAILFAAGAGTARTTIIILTGFVVLLFTLGMINDLAVGMFPELEHLDLGTWVLTGMVESPGPFSVFTGNWSLIDV